MKKIHMVLFIAALGFGFIFALANWGCEGEKGHPVDLERAKVLEVLSTTPEDGATGVLVNTEISAIFSKSVNTASINENTFIVQDSNGNPVDGVINYVDDDKTATFTPAANLNLDTTYKVTLTSGLRDVYGTPMQKSFEWNFSTVISTATLLPRYGIDLTTQFPKGGMPSDINFAGAIPFPWAKSYGGSEPDYPSSIVVTKDEKGELTGYIVAGSTSSFDVEDSDFWIFKLDAKGGIEWEKAYGRKKDAEESEIEKDCLSQRKINKASKINDDATSIKQTGDGGYIVVGFTDTVVEESNKTIGCLYYAKNAWILKLDKSGKVLWQKRYGGEHDAYSFSVEEVEENGKYYYIAAGGSVLLSSHKHVLESNLWVLKLNENGDVVQNKAYGSDGYDAATSIQKTKDGGYIVTGETSSFEKKDQSDIWVLKFDKNLKVSWQKRYGGDKLDRATSIQETADGGYIVAGATESFGQKYIYNTWILKLKQDGQVEWEKTFGPGIIDSVKQTNDDGYIIATDTELFGAGSFDIWLIKLDAQGNIMWQKTYGGAKGEWATSIALTGKGGYIVTGLTESFGAGKKDIWILKINEDGGIEFSSDVAKVIDSTAKPIETSAKLVDTKTTRYDGTFYKKVSASTRANIIDTSAVVKSQTSN